jgi:hypothetical protein
MVLSACTSTQPVASTSSPTPTASSTSSADASSTAPAVSEVSPAAGALSGGTTITIAGSGLSKVDAVTVGGVPATDVTVVDDKTVTAVTPAAANFQPADAALEVSAAGEPVSLPGDAAYRFESVTPLDKQMQYALSHWKDYNLAEWGNLNPVGGDCANFVSQTLIQRGWTQNPAWHNTNQAADWTPAWGYVPSMDQYFQATPSLGLTRLSLDQRDQVKVGDVAMFDWNQNNIPDHVMIVSQVTTEGDKTIIKAVGHNKDFDYRDLDETITVEHPGGNAWFWSVPA